MLGGMEGQPQPDLEMIGMALEDHSFEATWWLDPESGEVIRVSEYGDDDLPEDPEAAGWLVIEPAQDNAGYRDMEDFIGTLADPAARETLARTIVGRGAFRRFKDVLFSTFPEHGRAWHAFKDERQRDRAIEWLQDQGLLAPDALPVDEALRRARVQAEQELDPKAAYDQLVFALGRAKAAAAALVEADRTAWQPVADMLDQAAEAATAAEPPTA
jgi:hypothetical protein